MKKETTISNRLVLSLVVILMFITGCAESQAAPTPTAAPPTDTATPVPTQPPTDTPTPVPPTATNTPLPTATDTPVPPTSTPTRIPPTVTATATHKPTLPPAPKAPTASWKGIPIMPQATLVMEEEDFYGYLVKATVNQVRDFYEREMPRLGWQVSNIGLIEGGGFLLLCEKGGDSIAVLIAAKGDMTAVAIGAKK
jgi:hypothetical protein